MAGLDQLTAQRTQQSTGDRRNAQRAKSANLPDRLAEELVVGEAAKKLRVIVVNREDEANPLDSGSALGAHHHRSAGQLPRVDDLSVERTRENAVEKGARGVVSQPRSQRERIRTARAKLYFEHEAMMTRRMDTLTG